MLFEVKFLLKCFRQMPFRFLVDDNFQATMHFTKNVVINESKSKLNPMEILNIYTYRYCNHLTQQNKSLDKYWILL